jgi:hypothetical protein
MQAEKTPAALCLAPQVGFPTDPTDRSLEIGIAIRNARAVSDLLYVVCGVDADGTDSKLDELAHSTLQDAIGCIHGQLQLAVDLEEAESEARLNKGTNNG